MEFVLEIVPPWLFLLSLFAMLFLGSCTQGELQKAVVSESTRNDLQSPLDRAKERVRLLTFGLYVSPGNSPNGSDRFTVFIIRGSILKFSITN